MKKICLLLIFTLAVFFTGCKDLDSTTNELQIFTDNILLANEKGVVENYVFPEWLIERIDIIKLRPPSVTKVMIHEGKLNKQKIYCIIDMFSSYFYDFYTENGKRVSNQPDLYSTSKDWILIYEYGEETIEIKWYE